MMLTFFTTAEPFRGHSAIIQRNALQAGSFRASEIRFRAPALVFAYVNSDIIVPQ
jgi:hypothetical protein